MFVLQDPDPWESYRCQLWSFTPTTGGTRWERIARIPCTTHCRLDSRQAGATQKLAREVLHKAWFARHCPCRAMHGGEGVSDIVDGNWRRRRRRNGYIFQTFSDKERVGEIGYSSIKSSTVILELTGFHLSSALLLNCPLSFGMLPIRWKVNFPVPLAPPVRPLSVKNHETNQPTFLCALSLSPTTSA